MSREDWKRPEILPPDEGKKRIKITLSYDGSLYSGWQKQRSEKTIQSEVEKAVEKATGECVNIYASGRTDSGVHAISQCAHFDTSSSLPPEVFAPVLNSFLPSDIHIISSESASNTFHSRYSTLLREYCYMLKESVDFLPFDVAKITKIKKIPNLELLNEYSQLLLGTHDYTTFCSVKDTSSSHVRDIYHSSWEEREDLYGKRVLVYSVVGNAFLYHQVRSMVGTMILLALKEESPSVFKNILEEKNREKSLTVFPSDGLYLKRVIYSEDEFKHYEEELNGR